MCFAEKEDREGGRPIELSVKHYDKNGFIGKQEWGSSKFIAPCIFYAYSDPVVDQVNGSAQSSSGDKKVKSIAFNILS